jgi:hypothetical protein
MQFCDILFKCGVLLPTIGLCCRWGISIPSAQNHCQFKKTKDEDVNKMFIKAVSAQTKAE